MSVIQIYKYTQLERPDGSQEITQMENKSWKFLIFIIFNRHPIEKIIKSDWEKKQQCVSLLRQTRKSVIIPSASQPG